MPANLVRFSARWSGSAAGEGAARAAKDRANLGLLLEQVSDVPDEHRAAAFVCAAVVAMPDGRVEGVGTHDQLLATCPTYVEIVDSQLRAEEAA